MYLFFLLSFVFLFSFEKCFLYDFFFKVVYDLLSFKDLKKRIKKEGIKKLFKF